MISINDPDMARFRTCSMIFSNIYAAIVSIFIVSFLLSSRVVEAVGTPCVRNLVGTDPSSNISTQAFVDHGSSRTTLIFDSYYQTACCGVITGWQFQVYNPPPPTSDGCNSCQMSFLVWNNTNPSAYLAQLVGSNQNLTIVKNTTGITTTILIPQSQQIPIQPGYFIGWDGYIDGIEYYDAASSLDCGNLNLYGCTQEYLETNLNTQIGSLNNGKYYTFQVLGLTDSPQTYRYHAFQAIAESGAAPVFTNLPAAISINSSTPVGTSIYQIRWTDANSLDTLMTTFVRACPKTTLFAVNITTGVVSVNSSLNSFPALTHELTLTVTDNCQTTTSTLEITVVISSGAATDSRKVSFATIIALIFLQWFTGKHIWTRP